MLVDIGGGTTDIAVISLAVRLSALPQSLQAINLTKRLCVICVKSITLRIGERTVEEMKIQIGTVFPRPKEVSMDVRAETLFRGFRNHPHHLY